MARPKNLRGKRSGRNTAGTRDDASADDKARTTEQRLDELWRLRRAGARNFAGTTYQTLVAALVLVRSAIGELPFASIVPEGLEDIDCHAADGSKMLLQAKESSAGNFTLGQLLGVLAHAAQARRAEDGVAVITNAPLAPRLEESGWTRSLAEALDESVSHAAVTGLAARGVSDGSALLERSHLIVLAAPAFSEMPHLLGKKLGAPPEMAALVLAELLVQIGAASAEQRARLRSNPRTWTVSELDALAMRVLALVDRAALDEALRRGIVEHVGFQKRSDLPQEVFLGGVDATPSHIAADLDMPRPDLLEKVLGGLKETRSVVIVGPSGAGKSVALWRSARELSGAARIVRGRRVGSDEEVDQLAHYVRSLLPTQERPIVVCCDDLGRLAMSAWPAAARRLLELPGVYVLAAVREEDVDDGIVRVAPRMVRVSLDVDAARGIHGALRTRGVAVRVGFEEAWERSSGLLLEFVAIAIGGDRLENVVGAQAEERLGPGRELELDALRLVCTAHLAGAALPPATLFEIIGASGGAYRKALGRLRDEHVIVENAAGNWTGLHELRSEVIVRVVHRVPPPSLDDTFVALLTAAPRDIAAAVLVFAARRQVELGAGLLEAVRARLAGPLAPADTTLLMAAAVADASSTASTYAELARTAVLPRLDIRGRILLAIGTRQVPGLAQMLDVEVGRLGKLLPPPIGVARAAALESLRGRSLEEALHGLSAADVVRFLRAIELLGPSDPIPATELRALVRGLGASGEDLLALPGACERVGHLNRDQLQDIFGPLPERLAAFARSIAACFDCAIEPSEEGEVVRLDLMAPLDGGDAHAQAVAACTSMREACPDADVYEVRTAWPGGASYVFSNHEPGHKRIPKANLPRPRETNFNALILDEVARTSRARFWTEWVRALGRLSADALRLVEEAFVRLLNPGDSATRRERWSAEVASLGRAVPELPHAPSENSGPDRALDLPGRVLGEIATALRQLDEGRVRGADATAATRVGWQLRAACASLEKAAAAGYPSLADESPPLAAELKPACNLLGDLLLAMPPLGEPPPRRLAGETWRDAAARIVEGAARKIAERESELLKSALATAAPSATLVRMPRVDFTMPHLITDVWVVLVDHDAPALAFEDLRSAIAATEGALAGRIYVLCRFEDLAFPLGHVCYAERSVLLPREQLEAAAAAAGLRLPSGTARTHLVRVCDELAACSSRAWLAARRERVLGEPWNRQALLDSAREGAAASMSAFPSDVVEALESLLGALAEDVAAEEPGTIARALLEGEDPYEMGAVVFQLHLRAIAFDEIERAAQEHRQVHEQ